jgi:hypothetical protein
VNVDPNRLRNYGLSIQRVLELVVYPAIYEIWKWHFEMKPGRTGQQPAALAALPSAEAAS